MADGAALAAMISKNGNGKASPAHSNVFVGNIASTVTEDDLRAAFASHGAIESVLLTSKAGRPSGFVKMVDVDGAAAAVGSMNGKDGWVVKFANYDVGQAPKWSSKGKGFGFPMFPDFGGWGKGGGGWGKGFPMGGYGKGYGGKMGGGWDFMKGGFGKGGVPELREDGPEKEEPPASDNLYIKHLPLGVTEDNVRDTFKACGEITELRILRPDFALECAALVRFSTSEEAEKARNTLDDTVVQGSTAPLYARAPNSKQGSATKTDHVYVKNIPTNTSEDKIKGLMEKNGEVKWFKVMRVQQGQARIGSTCAALFEMASEAEAVALIAVINENVLEYHELCPPMRVRYAANKTVKVAPATGVNEAAADAEGAAPEEMPVTRLAV